MRPRDGGLVAHGVQETRKHMIFWKPPLPLSKPSTLASQLPTSSTHHHYVIGWLLLFWVVCQKTLPHNICTFMCRYREMCYYFILTAAQTLIILTILANFCLFLIISRSESCFNVYLPSWSQFSYSVTPTRLCLYSSNTSPLWICLFFSHCMSQRHISVFSRFFLLLGV